MDVELAAHRALTDLAFECGQGAFFPIGAIEAQIDWPNAMTVPHRATVLRIALENLRSRSLVNRGLDDESQDVWQSK